MSGRSRYVPPPVSRTAGRTEPVRQATGGAAAAPSSTPPATSAATPQGQPQAVKTASPAEVSPAPKKRRKKSGKRNLGSLRKVLTIAWAGLTVLLVAAAVVFWRQANQGVLAAVDIDKYQAVFLTSGQVYFGKLHPNNNESVKLTDVYYLQTQAGTEADSENPQNASADNVNVQLVKLGNEIHGPQDEMIVYKTQVLFYENLKPDSQVVRSIEQHKANK